MHMRSRLILVLLSVLLVSAFSIPVFAQKETGVILGTITDGDGGPMPGVTVTAASPALIGGKATAYSDAEGHYRFAALPPGTYEIAAELQGFQNVIRKDVRLYVGNSLKMDLAIQAEKVSESMVITGESPLIDVTTAATSQSVPIEAVENLPKFSFALDLFTLTPGVGNLPGEYVAYGAGGDSANAYWLDGVDVSDPEGGTPWVFPNYNWIQEVQVIGIGAPAEYGQFTGVVSNSITRSGGNEFHGLAETFFQNDGTTGDNTGSLPSDLQDDFTPTTVKKFSDNTFQVGGPIIHDKLWFFSGFQYFAEDRVPLGYTSVRSERDPRFITKLTDKINANNTLQGFIEWDRYDIDGRGADSQHLPESTRIEKAPEVSWNGTWISLLNPETVLDARFSGFWGYYHLFPRNGPNVSSHFDPCETTDADGNCIGLYSENAVYTYLADRQRYQANVSLSHYARDFIKGDHDFKFGVEFERSGVQSKYYYNGGIYYYDYNNSPYYRYLWGGYDIDTPLHRTSSYAQDSWNITKKLNLNIGVRWDHDRGIIQGVGTAYKTDPVAPRVGFTYDVKADQKTVIKGHYGRYYEAMFSDSFAPASPGWGAYTTQYFYPGYGFYTTSYTPHVYRVDSNIKQPYLDQWTVGLDQELPGNIAFGFHYIHRRWHDGIDDVNESGVFVPVTVTNPLTGEPITGFNQLNPGEDRFVLTNAPGLFRKYDGYQFTANRRMANNLYLSGSVVYSKTRGNYDNGSYTGGGSNTGLYSRLFNDPNFNINIDGIPSYDPTWEVKLQGIYNLPWGINSSWYYTYYTAETYTARARIGRSSNGDFNQGSVRIFVEPRGSRRLDDRHNLDFRLEKEFPVSKGQLRFTADIFNLFNSGYVTDVETRFDTSSFEQPLSLTGPRAVRLGVRYTF